MNDIYHRTYILEFDVWDPQKKIVDTEFDALVFDLKNKALLPHVGNLKIRLTTETRI